METRTQESVDFENLVAAIKLVRRDPTRARQLLLDVVANAPETYVYRWQEGDTEYVRCWDQAEFVAYSAYLHAHRAENEGVQYGCWQPSIYPRAYYYLAFLAVEAKCYEEAKRYLEAALSLEPDQPEALRELANVERGLGNRERAAALYTQVLTAREWVPVHSRAAALRGLAVELIDAGRLDEAETRLRESLDLEPRSYVAKHELRYIKQLRSHHTPAGLHNVITGGGPPKCRTCGKKLESGPGWRVVTEAGREALICPACDKGSRRPWWQFWRVS